MVKKDSSYVVDFAALAQGDLERAREGWRRGARTANRNRWKKDRARRKAARAVRKAKRGRKWSQEHAMKYPIAGWRMLACRMEEGEWYGLADIRELMAEAPRNSVKAWFYQYGMKAGIYERALNEDFETGKYAGNQSEPQYLFRLNVRGLASVAQWKVWIAEG